MKRYHAFAVLFLLLAPSIYMGLCSYEDKRAELLCDMNQALAKTLETQRSIEISPDTIHAYLSHLHEPALRERSYIYYAMERPDSTLCSERLQWSDGENECEFRGYASVSAAGIIAMSDQRWSLSLLMLSLLWGAFSVVYFKRQDVGMLQRLGTISLQRDGRFYNAHRQTIHFTPMQEQLMKMFFAANGHRLSKQEICDALWPRKPDASDTLYTLIKRLKPIVEEQGGLHIDCERGREYTLRD